MYEDLQVRRARVQYIEAYITNKWMQLMSVSVLSAASYTAQKIRIVIRIQKSFIPFA